MKTHCSPFTHIADVFFVCLLVRAESILINDPWGGTTIRYGNGNVINIQNYMTPHRTSIFDWLCPPYPYGPNYHKPDETFPWHPAWKPESQDEQTFYPYYPYPNSPYWPCYRPWPPKITQPKPPMKPTMTPAIPPQPALVEKPRKPQRPLQTTPMKPGGYTSSPARMHQPQQARQMRPQAPGTPSHMKPGSPYNASTMKPRSPQGATFMKPVKPYRPQTDYRPMRIRRHRSRNRLVPPQSYRKRHYQSRPSSSSFRNRSRIHPSVMKPTAPMKPTIMRPVKP